jgi:hypothetical protein
VSFVLVRTSGAEIATGGGGIVFGPPDSLSWVLSWSVGLHLGEAYQIHYWFDSNFGGGTAGVCDAPEIDHQWKVLIPAVAGDIDVLVSHDPNAVTDVCSSFSR